MNNNNITKITNMKRFYRSSKNYLIGGVCGGIGEYIGFDPFLLRVALAVSAVYSPSPVTNVIMTVYIIIWVSAKDDMINERK